VILLFVIGNPPQSVGIESIGFSVAGSCYKPGDPQQLRGMLIDTTNGVKHKKEAAGLAANDL
jgi:hypothetical protein